MTHTEARSLVRGLRRQFVLATLVRVGLVAIVAGGIVVAAMAAQPAPTGKDPAWTAIMFAGLAWIVLTAMSARQVRAANQASVYISSGRIDLAEDQLKTAMRAFSLHRRGKYLVCHNLAVLEHGQKNYTAAAELCDGVIAMGVGIKQRVGRLCRILLADCRLLLGDATAAQRAIASISVEHNDLTLTERLLLLPVELRCQAAQGDYAAAAESLSWKVRLAEQLDSPKAALVHWLLAEACRRTGQASKAAFLQRRAALYHDLPPLKETYALPLDSTENRASADKNKACSG